MYKSFIIDKLAQILFYCGEVQMSTINGQKCKWEMVIGVEVHAQIVSNSKLFSGASTCFGAQPNSQVSLVDCAMPGMLPVLNEECIRHAVASGIALNARINMHSIFDRKSYFYPDLPQGYQITQLYHPIAEDGFVQLTESSDKKVKIVRLHIEQDAGKSMHISGKTFIDLNRAGIGLMEIVSAPDMSSADEVGEFLRKLRSILRFVGSCDGDMEKGSFRCDANVSVRPVGSEELGTRCEIKNLNSIKFVQQAVLYEAQRQVSVLENNGQVQQSTMSFDSSTGKTSVIRTKEDVSEYRYFPDPDLRPVNLTQEFVDSVRLSMPELPDEKRNRYINVLGLTSSEADILISDKWIACYFEEIITAHNPKISANWIIVELFGMLNKEGLSISNSPISARKMIGLLDNIENGVLSGKLAKEVFLHMFKNNVTAEDVIKNLGIQQITDHNEILCVVTKVLQSNPKNVKQYLSGKERVYGFFIGQIMKETSGKANPEIVNNLLKNELSKMQKEE